MRCRLSNNENKNETVVETVEVPIYTESDYKKDQACTTLGRCNRLGWYCGRGGSSCILYVVSYLCVYRETFLPYSINFDIFH